MNYNQTTYGVTLENLIWENIMKRTLTLIYIFVYVLIYVKDKYGQKFFYVFFFFWVITFTWENTVVVKGQVIF